MGVASGELADLEGESIAGHAPPAVPTGRVITAGLIGNVMEWYDFAIYGYFAVAIGANFFPAADPVSSTLAAFAVFAVGFLARPLGGVLFGHIGDRIGRKPALTASVVLMAVPTVLIGLLPTHAQIGALAGAALVLLRLLQGLAVGGEFTTSVAYAVEHAHARHRGRDGSWMWAGAIGGILLGSAVGALISSVMPADRLSAWGWRLPFLFSVVVGLFGLWLRRRLPEAPLPARAPGRERLPILIALETEWRTMLRVMVLCLPGGIGFYTVFVFVVSYLQTFVHVPEREVLEVNTLSMIGYLGCTLLGGVLSDRLGRKPVAIAAMAGLLLLAWPLFDLLDHPRFAFMLSAQLCMAASLGLYFGQLPALLVEALPGQVRCTAVSLSYNFSVGLSGGLTPLVATWLIQRTGDEMVPAIMLMMLAAVVLLALWRTPETAGMPLR
jgi:MHS family proline/betaine transporter-like MFS transporter